MCNTHVFGDNAVNTSKKILVYVPSEMLLPEGIDLTKIESSVAF